MSKPDLFDHISLSVSDLPRAVHFYQKALAPLGVTLVAGGAEDGYAGFGGTGAARLWLGPGTPTRGAHLALCAGDRAAVDAFHAAALAAGGSDNGPPGLRPDYGAGYYAAFVLDPDGSNLEAVVHE